MQNKRPWSRTTLQETRCRPGHGELDGRHRGEVRGFDLKTEGKPIVEGFRPKAMPQVYLPTAP